MSRITLSGNASGTGNFTLASPNSNTDRTLTLPDATGTVVLANGSGDIATTSVTPSAGIYLGGTGSANLLDDYEEGTWTPTVRGAATAGTYTLSGVSARYVKIGSQVTLWAKFGFSAASGGTNYAQILGLPFSYQAGGDSYGTILTNNFNFSSAAIVTATLAQSSGSASTILNIVEVVDNSGVVDSQVSGISTSTTIGFTFTYTTA